VNVYVNNKFWEELVLCFPSATVWVSDATSTEGTSAKPRPLTKCPAYPCIGFIQSHGAVALICLMNPCILVMCWAHFTHVRPRRLRLLLHGSDLPSEFHAQILWKLRNTRLHSTCHVRVGMWTRDREVQTSQSAWSEPVRMCFEILRRNVLESEAEVGKTLLYSLLSWENLQRWIACCLINMLLN
jgi:hypothetical protein